MIERTDGDAGAVGIGEGDAGADGVEVAVGAGQDVFAGSITPRLRPTRNCGSRP